MKFYGYVFAFVVIASPAIAADKTPPKPPACGAIAEDCQRVVDAKDKQIVELRTAFQTARQQRINAQTAQADAEINAAILAADAAPPAPAK